MKNRATNRKIFSFGLGGLLAAAVIVAGLAAHRQEKSARPAAASAAAPLSFREMERPDPVLLLTPVRLPDRRLLTP